MLVLRVRRILACVEDERIFAGIQGGTNVSWCRGWDEREPGTKIIGGMAKN